MMVAVSAITKIVDITISAFCIISKGMVLPKASILFLPRITESMVKKITPRVTVLIPPAVLTGEPPTSISNEEKNLDISLKVPWSMVKKPTVLTVTDWNSEACTFSGVERGPKVAGLLHSQSRKNSVPPIISAPVTVRTILVCSDK